MPRVIGDDVGGGALAARHLLDLGHTDGRVHRGRSGGPVRLHLEPRSTGGLDAGARRVPGSRSRRSGSATARTVDTRRANWPVGCSRGDRPPDRDLRGQRYPGARRHRRRARARTPGPGRPVGHRLRRHRGCRLRRPHDHPPAALRVRAAGRRDPDGRDRRPVGRAARRPNWPQSSWFERQRRRRRRAVDEDPARRGTRQRNAKEEEAHGQHRDHRHAGARGGASRRRPRDRSWSAACAAPGAVRRTPATLATAAPAAPLHRRAAAEPVRERRDRRPTAEPTPSS